MHRRAFEILGRGVFAFPLWILRGMALALFRREQAHQLEEGEKLLTLGQESGTGPTWVVSDRAVYMRFKSVGANKRRWRLTRIRHEDIVDAFEQSDGTKVLLTLRVHDNVGGLRDVIGEFRRPQRKLLRVVKRQILVRRGEPEKG